MFFPCKVAPASDDTSCVRRVRLRSNRSGSVPPLCSAMSGCSVMRAYFYAFLDSLVADRSVMAASSLSFCVAMCVKRCGFGTCFATQCLQIALSWLVQVAWRYGCVRSATVSCSWTS